jgi:hypothetical protein
VVRLKGNLKDYAQSVFDGTAGLSGPDDRPVFQNDGEELEGAAAKLRAGSDQFNRLTLQEFRNS